MKIVTSDGVVFEAPTAKGIVSQMRRSQWSAPSKKGEYMREVADHVAEVTGKRVRADEVDAFLVDLEHAGLCRVSDLSPAQARRWTALLPMPDEEESPDNTPPSHQSDAQDQWDQAEGT